MFNSTTRLLIYKILNDTQPEIAWMKEVSNKKEKKIFISLIDTGKH